MATKDIFYDSIVNTNLMLPDFMLAGHSVDNTVLRNADYYKANEKVRDKFKDEAGNFDEKAFNEAYGKALGLYYGIVTPEVDKSLMAATAFDPSNIYVDPSLRLLDISPRIIRETNPERRVLGLYEVGTLSARKLSDDELAQGESVLLNPVAVEKGEAPIWGDAPTKHWFTDWKPKVLAQWDSEGNHTDPVTGLLVHHIKGELKTNANGTYYYENLDGRSVYGRRVLNKLNTLTEEGTRINQFDFFDSDDLELKHFLGTTFKNLALVGPMFIPGVGLWIALASAINLATGLSATLGKMFASSVGIDVPLFNEIEGFAQSTNRMYAKTQYANEHAWCWENLIGMVGDVAGLLREQRVIFEQVPGFLMGKNGKYGRIKEGANKLAKERAENISKKIYENEGIQRQIMATRMAQPAGKELLEKKVLLPIAEVIQRDADKYVQEYFKKYHALGERISRGYMTAVTVGDTYGEAIEAGASPIEATFLTLGYAALENELLKSDIGRWIFPELRMEGMRYLAIAKGLNPFRQTVGKVEEVEEKEAKKKIAKRLVDWGKKLASLDYSAGKRTLGVSIAQGLAEGFEEVSEEALADFSKGCFNTYKWLTGDSETRMDDLITDFNLKNDLSRYALNFLGGFGGGALSGVKLNYKQLAEQSKIDDTKALSELVWITRNGKLNEFTDSIMKQEIASRKLGTTVNPDTGMWNPGTDTDNLDIAAKLAILKLVKMIKDAIESEGASLNDNGVLATIMRAVPEVNEGLNLVLDFRYSAFARSKTAGWYLNRYNKLVTDIVKEKMNIDSVLPSSDSAELTADLKKKLKEYLTKLKALQLEFNDIKEGKHAELFLRGALFETNFATSELYPEMTEALFLELYSGKPLNEISEEEKKKLHDLYVLKAESGDIAEKIMDRANYFYDLVESLSPKVAEQRAYIDKLKELLQTALTEAMTTVMSTWQAIRATTETGHPEGNPNDTGDPILYIQNLLNAPMYSNPEEDLLRVEQAAGEEQLAIISEVLYKNVFNPLIKLINDIKKEGWIHPELKDQLIPALEKAYAEIATLNTFYTQDPQTGEIRMLDLDEDTDINTEVAPPGYESAWEPVLELKRSNYFGKAIDEIKALPNTPILSIIGSMAVDTKGQNVMGVILAALAKTSEAKSELSSLLLQKTDIETYDQAIHLLKLGRAALANMANDDQDIDNLSGNTKLLNAISDKKDKYYELDTPTAVCAIEDVNILIDRLESLKGIHELNKGNKLTTQTRTAANTRLILYEKTKKFVDAMGDDGWDKGSVDQLKQFLETGMNVHSNHTKYGASKIHKAADRILTFSELDKILFEAEHINLGEALHQFFVANLYDSSGHLKNDKDTIDKLVKLFKEFDFFKLNNDLLTDTSDSIDDNAFAWWLAATAGLDPKTFYDNYRQILDPKAKRVIAPLPTLELQIFESIAAISNGNIFDLFGMAMKEKVIADASSADIDLISSTPGNVNLNFANKEFIKGSDAVPNYTRIFFIEGIAGSGKSTGTAIPILKLLQYAAKQDNSKYAQLLTLDIWLVHTDENNASRTIKTILDDFDLKDFTFKGYGKDDFLKASIPNYKKMSDLSVRDNGLLEYKVGKDGDVAFLDGVLRTLWRPQELGQAKPSFVLIDEWSRYSLAEIAAIDEWANINGIQVIAMGDLDLLSPVCAVKVGEDDLSIAPSRNITARGIKMGISMRTDNTLKTINNNAVQVAVMNPVKLGGDKVTLYYRETEDGLFGDKVFHAAAQAGFDASVMIKDIDLMKNHLQPGEKIGFIYLDKTSSLYQLLTTKYADCIIPLKESLALGREARFYIAELIKTPSNLGASAQVAKDRSNWQSIYTATTRASLASLLVVSPVTTPLESLKNDNIELTDSYTLDGIKDFTAKRLGVLNQVYQREKELNPLPFIPRQESTYIPIEVGTDGQVENPEIMPGDNGEPLEVPVGFTPPNPEGSFPTPLMPEVPPNPSGPTPVETPSENPDPVVLEIPKPEKILNKKELLDMLEKFEIDTDIKMKEFSDVDIIFATGVWAAGYKDALALAIADGDIIVIDSRNSETRYSLKKYKTNAQPLKLLSNQFIEDIFNKNSGSICYKYSDLESICKSLEFLTHNLASILQELINNNILELKGEYYYKVLPKALPPVGTPDVNTVDEPIVYLDEDLSTYQGAIILLGQSLKEAEEGAEEIQGYTSDTLGRRIPIERETPGVRLLEGKLNQEVQDIDIDIHMETFATFDLGCKFDRNGKIDYNAYDPARIDSGYGLHALNPKHFNNRTTIEKFIGEFRLYAKFKSNKDISTWFKNHPNLQAQLGSKTLAIDWAFISKTDPSRVNNLNFGRFNKGKDETVEYLDSNNNHNVADPQYFAIVVYEVDANGYYIAPLLEMPLGLMESPFTIAYKSKQFMPSNVATLWNFIEKLGNNVDFPRAAFDMYKEIGKIPNLQSLPGWNLLRNLFGFWLFNSNGYISINEVLNNRDWCFGKNLENLGNHYVILRDSKLGSKAAKHQYSKKWMDLTYLVKRSDLKMSSILVLDAGNHITTKGTFIAHPGSPFILTSDSPDFFTDTDLFNQYIKQLEDPTAPKLVYKRYVSPPEVPLRTYLDGLFNEIKSDGKQKNTYGSEMQAFRILLAVYKEYQKGNEDAKYLIENYKREHPVSLGHASTVEYILINMKSYLDSLEPRKLGESLYDYRKRRLLAEINFLNKYTQNSGQHFAKPFKLMLLDMLRGGLPDYLDSLVSRLENVTKALGITGVLARIKWQPKSNVNRIGGYALLVQTDSASPFTIGGKSFRVDSKTDDIKYKVGPDFKNFINIATSAIRIPGPKGLTWPGLDGAVYTEGMQYTFYGFKMEGMYNLVKLSNPTKGTSPEIKPESGYSPLGLDAVMYYYDLLLQLDDIKTRIISIASAYSSKIDPRQIASRITQGVDTSKADSIEKWLTDVSPKITNEFIYSTIANLYNETPGNLGIATPQGVYLTKILNGVDNCDRFPEDMLNKYVIRYDLTLGYIYLGTSPTSEVTPHKFEFSTQKTDPTNISIDGIKVYVPRPLKQNVVLDFDILTLLNLTDLSILKYKDENLALCDELTKFKNALAYIANNDIPNALTILNSINSRRSIGRAVAEDGKLILNIINMLNNLPINQDLNILECLPYIKLTL